LNLVYSSNSMLNYSSIYQSLFILLIFPRNHHLMDLWKKPENKFIADLSRPIFAEKENVEIALGNLKDEMARKGKFRIDWEGGLSDLKEKYTSVEFVHKSLEWRKSYESAI